MGVAGAIAGVGLVGQFVAGQQEADALRAEARQRQILDNLQADEILERAKINVESVRRESDVLTGDQVSAFAKAGVDVSSGSPLLVLAQAQAEAQREIVNIEREARFDAAQIRRGGAAGVRAANRAAAAIGLGGTARLLTGAVSLARSTPSGRED